MDGAASVTGRLWDINGEGTSLPTLVHLSIAYLTNYEIEWMCSQEAKMGVFHCDISEYWEEIMTLHDIRDTRRSGFNGAFQITRYVL